MGRERRAVPRVRDRFNVRKARDLQMFKTTRAAPLQSGFGSIVAQALESLARGHRDEAI